MTYLLLTTSPFQLLNALIYSADDAEASFCLVINENLQTESEVRQFEFVCDIFNIKVSKMNFSNWFSYFFEINQVDSSGFECAIFGPTNHWSAFLAAFLPINKLVIVDDGAHSLSSFKSIEGRITIKAFVLKLLEVIFNFFISKKNVERLSLFSLQTNYKLSKPDYTKLSHLTRTKDLDFSFDDKTVVFVGTPISEAGIITLDTEVSSVSMAAKFYWDMVNNENFKFLYVAHRRDSEEKLRRLSACGISYVRLSGPLELYLAESLRHSNVRVCSLTSTVLFTAMNMGYKTSRLCSFKIPEQYFLKEYKEKYERIYKSFQESGVEIVSS